MDQVKPENIEKTASVAKADVEKAEVNLRVIERAKPTQSDSSKTALNVKDVRPNTTYEKNGYTYQTDNLARTRQVSGSLRLEKEDRNPGIQKEVSKLGEKSDQGGHIIGAQFAGSPDAFNLFPQNSDFNSGTWSKSGWANMEREWKSDLKDGKTVNVSVDLRYGDNSKRPNELYVRYEIPNGKSRELIFQNQAHDQIRYFSGGNR